MIRAKNYETVFKFVKVMPRKLWPLFFPDTVYSPTTLKNKSVKFYSMRICSPHYHERQKETEETNNN